MEAQRGTKPCPQGSPTNAVEAGHKPWTLPPHPVISWIQEPHTNPATHSNQVP
jgi:hypothetical protein